MKKTILLLILALFAVVMVAAQPTTCGLSDCQPYSTADERATPFNAQPTGRCAYNVGSNAGLASDCYQGPPADDRWFFHDYDCILSGTQCLRDCLECNATGNKCDRLVYTTGSQTICNNDCDCEQPGFITETVIPEMNIFSIILILVICSMAVFLVLRRK